MQRSLLSLTIALLMAIGTTSAQPANTGTYYLKAHGLSGRALKTALHQIVRMPSVVDYDSLWHAYERADARPVGDSLVIWDMYSCVSRYSIYSKLHGNGKVEGEKGFQREHSMPKSWFNPTDRNSSNKLTYKDIKPMYSDMVHVIPTDGTVNNKRSNKAYGEIGDSTQVEWASAEGFSKYSKKGGCTTPGWREYLGDDYKKARVFEPNDEYKGDLARIYFYMATCYEDTVGTWSGEMFDSASTDGYQPFAEWAFNMLMRWAQQDPVSSKEIERNEACYRMQGNRNPFVDYPGLEDYVWGRLSEEPFDYGGDVPDPMPAANCDVALNSLSFGVDWEATGHMRDYFDRTPLTYSQDGINITFAYGVEGSRMYCDPQQMRLYNRNTLTFQANDNCLTRIAFSVPDKSADKELIPSVGQMDGNTWTGLAQTVEFTSTYTSSYPASNANKHIQIDGASITVGSPSGIQQADVAVRTADKVFTLSGMRIDGHRLSPGIYIRNGKKIIVRP